MKTTILQFSIEADDDQVTYEVPGEPDLPTAAWAGPERLETWTEEDGDPEASYDTSEAHLDEAAAVRLLRGELCPWTLEDRLAP